MLKRVSIQNFKSLKDVTLDLQKVNLLIGPNNSGKTNFLKALEFVSDSVGGAIKLPKEYRYRKDIGNSPDIHLIFDSIYENGKYDHVLIGDALNEEDEESGFAQISFANYFDIINSPNSPEDIDWKIFEKGFGLFDVYKIDSNKLDKPAPIGEGSTKLNKDASNMIAFFDRMRDEFHDNFSQIRNDLGKCLPEFTEINFQIVKSSENLIKEFGDKTFKRIGLTNGKQKTIYWADELSEGTLYFLALLCIINQPNPPKFLLLEEPEKGIHPRRIFEVIQFILRLSEEKDVQVIMTTHSPIVVDMFADMTESVFIFDKDEEGATHVKNLQRDVIEPDTEKSKELGFSPPKYTDALGDSWTIGFLGGVPK
ncbi:AAA family ATPase [Spirosoma spitsbergense]|uniref:AAA family ATPase n=1 Tax=Spirosoma spitsbergense TaxID=431554 RepID=UPI00035E4996|nr:AAA family ATPase [Spirosoma spitsbergense]